MLLRTIEVEGFKVDVMDFNYAQFYYPQFNGDAEFSVSSSGFKALRHYLRTINWLQELNERLW